eukprot:TRINITY_DN808_c0_g1_i1.p1 TRINITY_DN808_c0_g1~~TRINITY_DN808_c0_g1_i1.p1  ORF type:complete len:139 (+),score=30.18 TRINITY_DN808_c0_g1_i1:53-418(+)
MFGRHRGPQTLVSFKAGKCSQTGTTVTPDARKGTLILLKDDDNMLHLQWMDRTSGATEDDFILFPGAQVVRVDKVVTGRVFTIDLGGRNAFYWMQEPDSQKDKDEDLIRQLNDNLNVNQGF